MKSANWWMCWASALWLSVGCALGETETVDGIKWTYTVSGGIASLGGRYAPSPAIGAIAIPSLLGGYPVRNIWRYAFYGCSGLTSITIPDSVTNIVGGAFTGCSSLESFSVADENPTYKSVSGLLLTKDGKKLVEGVNGDVVIPGSVTNIGSDAFYGRTGLTSVVIPDSVTSIGSDAFHECNGLTSVTIGSGVKSIGTGAFGATYGCYDFTSVFIHDLAAWCEISFEGYYSNPLVLARHLYLDGEEVAGDLVIPDGTTSIGNRAFYECSGLTNVTIPDSVMSIGEDAFWNCSGLTGLTIGNGVTNIGDSAFYGCTGLTNVAIPGSVKSIGSGAFSDCSGLTDMAIPEGVVSIREFAFSGCYGLTNVTIPDSVTSIGDDAFGGCDALDDIYTVTAQGVCILDGWVVGRIYLPFGDLDLTGVRGIADRVFAYCDGLESVTIPDGVSRIGNYAFECCSSLTNVTIPDGVRSIGSSSFSDCTNLASVTIPASVTTVESNAFYNCYGLTAVCIQDLAAWCGISFEDSYSTPLDYAHHLYLDGEEVVDLVIPDGVTSIGYEVFRGCSGLASVTIPDSVTSIENDAFLWCNGLTNVSIGNSVTNIGNSAFYGCTGLTSVVISDSVTSIGGSAFQACSALTSVTIPDSVTSIGNSAFYGCKGLTNVTIPDSVTSIGSLAFSLCSSLESFSVADANPTYKSGSGLLLSKDGRTLVAGVNGNVVIPDGVTSIGNAAFYGCSNLTGVAIPDSITSIEARAFEHCSGLTSMTIPDSVTSVGNNAFSGCSGLETLYVPASWEGSTKLAKAGVPEGCVVIYRRADAATSTTPVSVPLSWMEENAGSLLAEHGGDYEAAAGAAAANGRPVWECYLTGVDPAVSNQLFEASLEYDENGKLTVKWTPDLNEDGTKSERLYWVKGKKDVMDEEWSDVTDVEDLEEEGWNFFRVGVKMP